MQMDFAEPLTVSSGYTADILNVYLPIENQKEDDDESLRRLSELMFIKVPIPLPQ